MLQRELSELEETVEKVSKDAARDKGIAQEISGQSPDEMLEKMKQMLDAAEEKLGKSDAAQGDLEAARENFARAQVYRTGEINTIDLYLMMRAINYNISEGHHHNEAAVAEARRAATATHHTGFGSSGSGSFGGGHMGGGSHGGGKW
jgi:uncharacterized membrane protein YgcG